jgi:site-specific DNA-methyltransferase (adenine-specific)
MEKYSVIYANPPWMYNKHTSPGKDNTEDVKMMHPNGRMPLEEIMAFPVEKIAEDNCVLFLWTTTPMLPEAIAVINAWGFVYKTLITWEKINEGCMGYWFKTCTEHLLVAVKGNIKAFGSPVRNCFHEPQIRRGRKPDYFYHLIEKVTNGRKIELFARRRRKGWDACGRNLEDAIPLWTQLF